MAQLAVVRKETFSAAHGHGIDHQPELVDQIVLEECLEEIETADHVDVTAVLLLQGGYGLGDAALEHGRVASAAMTSTS